MCLKPVAGSASEPGGGGALFQPGFHSRAAVKLRGRAAPREWMVPRRGDRETQCLIRMEVSYQWGEHLQQATQGHTGVSLMRWLLLQSSGHHQTILSVEHQCCFSKAFNSNWSSCGSETLVRKAGDWCWCWTSSNSLMPRGSMSDLEQLIRGSISFCTHYTLMFLHPRKVFIH